MKSNLQFRLFSILCIITLCIGLTFKYLQNDTFYIIKLGELIKNNGIDFVDHYSWISGLPYTYPHWLYDLILYLLYDSFGFNGVYISVIFCFIILVLIIYFVHLHLYKNEFMALLVANISVFRLSMFMVARAQIISLPLFILEVYFIDKLIKSGKNKYIFFLAICSLLIANIHATAWLFYFILFLPFIGEFFVYKFLRIKFIRKLYKLDKINFSRIVVENIGNIKKVFIAMFLSFIMGLLTPSKICYTYVIRIMLGNSQSFISEHFPLVVIENPFFIFLIFIFVLILFVSRIKIYLRELFMICGLMLLSLISIRHLSFFYTIGFLYIVILCVRYLDDIGDNTLNILKNIMIKKKFICLGLLIIIISFSSYKFIEHSKEKFVKADEYPIEAAEFIKSNLDVKNIKLYNEYNYGSYLLFKDIPVFIDSRCDLYLKEFNGMDYSIFNEALNIEFNYEKKFKSYNITNVLLSKKNAFYIILIKDTNYNTIYEDKNFILFERKV